MFNLSEGKNHNKYHRKGNTAFVTPVYIWVLDITYCSITEFTSRLPKLTTSESDYLIMELLFTKDRTNFVQINHKWHPILNNKNPVKELQ